MNNHQDSLGFDVYFEGPAAYRSRMRQYIIRQMKSACENSQFGAIIVVARDAEGNEIGRNEIGSPTDELRAMADEEDEDPVPVAMIKEK